MAKNKNYDVDYLRQQDLKWGNEYNKPAFLVGLLRGLGYTAITLFAPEFFYGVSWVLLVGILLAVVVLNILRYTTGWNGAIHGFMPWLCLQVFAWGMDGNAVTLTIAIIVLAILTIWTLIYFLPFRISHFSLHLMMRRAFE